MVPRQRHAVTAQREVCRSDTSNQRPPIQGERHNRKDALALALSILGPFKESRSIFDDYQVDEGFTDEEYEQMLSALREMASRESTAELLREALAAIVARVRGEFDHPALLTQGPLGDLAGDIVRFAERAWAASNRRPTGPAYTVRDSDRHWFWTPARIPSTSGEQTWPNDLGRATTSSWRPGQDLVRRPAASMAYCRLTPIQSKDPSRRQPCFWSRNASSSTTTFPKSSAGREKPHAEAACR